MKKALIIFLTSLSLGGNSALAASPSDAREVARLNNCPPKKIEVFQQSLGTSGKTTYRVECLVAKGTGEQNAANSPDAVLIGCSGSLCEFIRPVKMGSK